MIQIALATLSTEAGGCYFGSLANFRLLSKKAGGVVQSSPPRQDLQHVIRQRPLRAPSPLLDLMIAGPEGGPSSNMQRCEG
jgi:hypothetical protein